MVLPQRCTFSYLQYIIERNKDPSLKYNVRKNFPKKLYFPESFKFETMNKQKQPEKKPFTTASSLVVFHTNDFSDLIDKSTSQG